ncbi:MAG: 3-hydroxybutyryl-CoA dehydrogenase [Deltaproteobacteria bacterium]|nr:3-hydroxybutyryl-CoA dehydrogenase [Deltaproteobacteria bacterium]
MSKINKMSVVGAGQMGAGIAQVAASAGLAVVVTDMNEAALERGKASVIKSLSRMLKKEKISQDEMNATVERIQWATELNAHADCDLVIEAIVENEGIKKELFAELDKVVKKDAILASNTSSISITRLAAATNRPEQFIGMHFMNPVPVMKLVEVIRGIATNDATYQATRGLAESMNKVTTVSKDYPGFLANRILMPMINEAFFALMEGVGSADDIDVTMKLGTNQPMGPLALADFIGLDTCLSIMEVLHDGLGDGKYRPCPLLRQHVDAGWMGRKSGRGVFVYDS